jgi:hypothetical protein
LHALSKRRHRFDALFLTEVYLGSKFCSSFSEALVSEFLLGIFDTFVCLMFILPVHQLLMPLAETVIK